MVKGSRWEVRMLGSHKVGQGGRRVECGMWGEMWHHVFVTFHLDLEGMWSLWGGRKRLGCLVSDDNFAHDHTNHAVTRRDKSHKSSGYKGLC